jgi:hypothetical protein
LLASAVEVIFDSSHFPSSSEVVYTAENPVVPLFSYLERYPAVSRLTLDCSNLYDIRQAGFSTDDDSVRFASGTGDNNDYTAVRIRDLRIHLPALHIWRAEENFTTLSRLSRGLILPELRKLHIVITLEELGWELPTPTDRPDWTTVFKGLECLAARWGGSLRVVKLCVNCQFQDRDSLFLGWDIWVSDRQVLLICQCALEVANYRRIFVA